MREVEALGLCHAEICISGKVSLIRCMRDATVHRSESLSAGIAVLGGERDVGCSARHCHTVWGCEVTRAHARCGVAERGDGCLCEEGGLRSEIQGGGARGQDPWGLFYRGDTESPKHKHFPLLCFIPVQREFHSEKSVDIKFCHFQNLPLLETSWITLCPESALP